MSKIKYILFALFTTALFASKTVYVSTTGNDTNPGTFAAPYLTLSKAMSSVAAGDTIIMRGGVYSSTSTITISKNGTSSARYYLLAYAGERPIIDFTGQSTGSRGISLSGSYWHIKGLDIRLSGDNGMFISGSENIVEYCALYENQDTGMQLGSGASNNRIINCDSYWNRDAGEGNADGFSPKLTVGSGNYFYGCRAWQNSDDGWDGYLRGSNDVTTTLENCWCFANGYRKDGTASTGNGNGFKMGGSDDKTLMHNFVLKNCLATHNRVKGFDQNNNKGSMTLYNCTGYSNGTNYSISAALNSGKTLTLTNCAALGSYGSLGAFAVQTTNSWMSPFSVSTADFVTIDSSGLRGPRNADGSLPSISYMHLAAGSDLIDGGTNVGIAYYGTAPDLGAFEYNPTPGTPTLTTTAVTTITSLSASSGGNITGDGGAAIIARGVCWNTTGNPTTASTKTTDGTGSGTFTSLLTGLSSSTTYYVRAYATNNVGTSYGGQISFTTSSPPVAPTVTTTAISSITNTTAISGGTVNADGGTSVTARGVCWNTSGSPSITDSKTVDGSGTGSFASSLTGLTLGTTYYARAYATNSVGTSYGSELSFTTTSASLTVPVLTTAAVSSITSSSASTGGNITSDGGAAVTVRGVCWNVTGLPAITDFKTTDGPGTGNFTSSVTGLSPNTLYYVRAYATNSMGTGYGGEVTFTTSAATPSITQGFNETGVWPTSAPTTETSVTVSGQGTWIFYQAYQVTNATYICDASYGDLRLLKVASPYTGGYGVSPLLNGVGDISFVEGRGSRTVTIEKSTDGGTNWSLLQTYSSTRCTTFSISVNDATINRIRLRNATTSDMDIDNLVITSYSSGASVPTVATSAISAITTTGATGGGTVSSDGGAAVTARGICYNTSGNPTLSDLFTSDGSGTGTFISTLSALTPSTTYYVRAYAVNSAGTGYGNEVSFTTLTPVTIASVATTAVSNVANTSATSGGNISADGGAAVSQRGVCWNTSGAPTTADNITNDGTGTGEFSSLISGLSASTLYYVRAYAINSAGTAYGSQVSFTTTSTSATVPVLSTTAVSNLGTNQASSGGNVTSDGGAAVTQRGLCWNLTGTPTIADSILEAGSGTGQFTVQMSGLTAATTYYIRAYAVNSVGTAYGAEITFNTLASITYYNSANSDITLPTNWGTISDGTGNHPVDFSVTNSIFQIVNSGASLSQNLSLTGSGSKIVVGNGSTAVTFTIPSTRIVSATVDVSALGALILQGSSYPAFGAISTAGTIVFDGANALTIPALNYGSLISTNDAGASRTLASTGTIGIAGTFTKGSAAYTVTGSSVSFNGSAAQSIPAFTFNNLVINNSAGAATAGQVVVNGLCTVNQNLTISSGDTLWANGTTPLTIASSKILSIAGALNNTSTGTVTVSGSINVQSGGAYIVNANVTNSYNAPAATYASGSSLVVLQGVPRINQSSIGGNVVWKGSGSGTLMGSSITALSVGGDFTITSGKINNGSGGTSRTLTIGGNLNIQGGEYDIVGSPGSSSGNQVTTVNGGLNINGGKLFISAAASGTGTLNVKGNISHTAGEFGDSITYTNGTLTLNGTTGQSVASTGISNAINITVNNAAGISLGSDLTCTGTLTLTSGKIFLQSKILTLGTGSIISGTLSSARCIVGGGTSELRKRFAGTGSFTFPLGDTTGTAEFSPVYISFSSGVFSSGYVGVNVENRKHPSNASKSNFLNRYWEVTSSGITNFSADVKAAYLAADVTGSDATIYSAQWDGTKWTRKNLVNAAQDSIVISGLTNFGAFTAGESDYLGGAGRVTVTAIPEGFYNPTFDRLSLNDTFMVYLANTTAPYTISDSSQVIIDSLTFSGEAIFKNAADASYYVVFQGRNIIETWSAGSVAVEKGRLTVQNFSSVPAVYGGNVKQKGSRWCIYSGDVNQDGIVDYTDLSRVDNDAYTFTSGYANTDVTGDYFVDYSDLALVENNSNTYTSVQKPGTTARPKSNIILEDKK